VVSVLRINGSRCKKLVQRLETSVAIIEDNTENLVQST
jgi:hypothetical protein